jgi:signal peptidase I
MERYNLLAQEMGLAYLSNGGSLCLRVNGDSMAPTLRLGDVVWVEPVSAADLQPGDLVVARRAGDLVAHRFLYADQTGWRLKGDACPYPDDPLPAEALIGRAVSVERDGRLIRLDSSEMKAASSKLLRIGRLEASIFLFFKTVDRRMFASKTPAWIKPIERLAGLPFRWITRLLSS